MMGKRLVAAARKPLSTSGVRKERTWATHWSSPVGSFRVRGGAGGYGFAACAAVRRCLGGSSYQAQRLEAGEQRALVEQEAADDGLDVHAHMLGRVDA